MSADAVPAAAKAEFEESPPHAPGKSVLAALEALTGARHLARNITHVHRVPERAARSAPFPEGLHEGVKQALAKRGIREMYTHQSEAAEAVLRGEDVTVVTPTASGKTLCFNVPVLHTLMDEPAARALYLFPTKALAQDQFLELHALSQEAGSALKVYTFDGDTPPAARRAIRSAGTVVLTNPDMLHTGILPHHTGWIKLFEHLRYVVIDELHHYRGVFGSHVANVLRRLERICEFYGSRPQFICCSATIANPGEMAERLTGRQFRVVDDNGAPAGEKYFLFYNPPVVNEELGIRRGVVNEVRRIAARFLAAETQTIVFTRSRMRVEILLNYLRKTMTKLRRDPARIAGYRGGYLPNERRLIEQGVKSGEILAVVSTNALELGIDIGQLRAAIIAGYPGSVASTWQQAGRAGRKAETAVIVLVASSSPLDQYLIQHAEYFFGKAPESAIVNPDNPAILASHVKCAAFELPFVDGEMFGTVDPEPVLRYLADQNVLRHSGGKWYWSTDGFPSEAVSLRSASAENFVVVNVQDQSKVMAEVDYDSAPYLIHTEAIYMHNGKTYYIDNLDWDRRTAYARPIASDYYTDALAKSDIRVIQEDIADTELGTGVEEFPEPPESRAPDQEYPLPKDAARAASGPAAGDDVPRYDHEALRVRIERETGQSHTGAAAPPDVTEQLNVTVEAPLHSRHFGEVLVSSLVAKYKKIRFETHENVGYGDISVPALEMQTEAYWLTFREELRVQMEAARLDLGAGLAGIASLLAQTAPLFVLCDPRDIVAVPMVRSTHDELPTVYVYDRYPGGIGLARKIYDQDRRILTAALEVLAGCSCRGGCPGCTGPDAERSAPGKVSARVILEALLL